MDFSFKAFVRLKNVVMKNNQRFHVLKICASSYSYIAKSSRQRFFYVSIFETLREKPVLFTYLYPIQTRYIH